VPFALFMLTALLQAGGEAQCVCRRPLLARCSDGGLGSCAICDGEGEEAYASGNTPPETRPLRPQPPDPPLIALTESSVMDMMGRAGDMANDAQPVGAVGLLTGLEDLSTGGMIDRGPACMSNSA
jgi:hypothetical protein